MRVAPPLLALLLLLGCAACENRLTAAHNARIERAMGGPDYVTLAVVWPAAKADDRFVDGARLAVETINREGGLNGRPVRLVVRDAADTPQEAETVARDLVEDPTLVGVIGHPSSEAALTACVVYEHAGVLFIAPEATAPVLTESRFDYIVRPTPNDAIIADTYVAYIKKRRAENPTGWDELAITSDLSLDGMRMSGLLRDKLAAIGLRLTLIHAYLPNGGNVVDIAGELAALRPDATFLVGTMPGAAITLARLRDAGAPGLFLGGEQLNGPYTIDLAGKRAEGLIVPDYPDPAQNRHAYEHNHPEKAMALEKAFGDDVTGWGTHGYDMVILFADGVKAAGTTVPRAVAAAIRHFDRWQGVTGAYTFTRRGDIVADRAYLSVVKNGRFVPLESEPKEPIKGE